MARTVVCALNERWPALTSLKTSPCHTDLTHHRKPPPCKTSPLTRDLVLIGGGHTHALVLKRWGMKPLAGVRVTVINPGAVAAYSGMLPGFVAGHYARTDLELDLLRLARFAGARAVLGRATGIDRKRKLIHVEGRPPVHYDVASIDIGITSDMPDLAGLYRSRDCRQTARPVCHTVGTTTAPPSAQAGPRRRCASSVAGWQGPNWRWRWPMRSKARTG